MRVRVKPGRSFNQTGPTAEGGRQLVTYAEGEEFEISAATYKRCKDALEALDLSDELAIALERDAVTRAAGIGESVDVEALIDGGDEPRAPSSPARPAGAKKPKKGSGPPKFGQPTGHA